VGPPRGRLRLRARRSRSPSTTRRSPATNGGPTTRRVRAQTPASYAKHREANYDARQDEYRPHKNGATKSEQRDGDERSRKANEPEAIVLLVPALGSYNAVQKPGRCVKHDEYESGEPQLRRVSELGPSLRRCHRPTLRGPLALRESRKWRVCGHQATSLKTRRARQRVMVCGSRSLPPQVEGHTPAVLVVLGDVQLIGCRQAVGSLAVPHELTPADLPGLAHLLALR
jgi:hypothetical protein